MAIPEQTQSEVSSISSKKPYAVTAALSLATVSTVFPGFLIGALFQQVSVEFAVSTSRYGLGIGAFFSAAMAGSILLGKLSQRLGPRKQITAALVISSITQLMIATQARSFTTLVLWLALAGLVNSGNQSAVNLALTQANLPRLGLALTFKQASMPAASMLAGFAVPSISLTVGWRWAYVLGAATAVLSLAAVRLVLPRSTEPKVRRPEVRPAKTISTTTDLLLAGLAAMFMAFSVGALNGWVVSSAVDSGIGEGSAGILLSVGAMTGIAGRIVVGVRLDENRFPFRTAGLLTLVGALGIGLLSVRQPGFQLAAGLLAFGAGWVWPVPVNFAVIRCNPEAAGAATGVTQTGVYIGVASGAPIGGWMIQQFGFDTMWLLVAVIAASGALLGLMISQRFASVL